MTAAFTFLWLVSSSAWGKGLTDVKWATNPHHLVESCKDCQSGQFPSMGRLNASVVSGDKSLDIVTTEKYLILPSRSKEIGQKLLEAFLPHPVSSGIQFSTVTYSGKVQPVLSSGQNGNWIVSLNRAAV